MKIGKYLFGAFAVAACVTLTAAAPSMPIELQEAVKAYDIAQISGNRDALARWLANDYVLINGGGDMESKEQFIAESIEPTFKLDPFIVLNPADRVWSHGAVIAGEVYLTGRSEGKPFKAHIRFADVWAKRAGRWQVVFTQVTRMPAAPTDSK